MSFVDRNVPGLDFLGTILGLIVLSRTCPRDHFSFVSASNASGGFKQVGFPSCIVGVVVVVSTWGHPNLYSFDDVGNCSLQCCLGFDVFRGWLYPKIVERPLRRFLLLFIPIYHHRPAHAQSGTSASKCSLHEVFSTDWCM